MWFLWQQKIVFVLQNKSLILCTAKHDIQTLHRSSGSTLSQIIKPGADHHSVLIAGYKNFHAVPAASDIGG